MHIETKKGKKIPDVFMYLDDTDVLPQEICPLVVSMKHWEMEKKSLCRWSSKLGIMLKGGDALEKLQPDIALFSVIVMMFESFKDGRLFSLARLLKEHHGYAGKILARGDILPDQIPFMIRCGFDGFVVDDSSMCEYIKQAIGQEISVYFQPTQRKKEWVFYQRHMSSSFVQ